MTEPLMTATTKLQRGESPALAAQTQYAAATNIDSTTAPAHPGTTPSSVADRRPVTSPTNLLRPRLDKAGGCRQRQRRGRHRGGRKLAADSAEQPPLDSSTGTDEPGPHPAEAKPQPIR